MFYCVWFAKKKVHPRKRGEPSKINFKISFCCFSTVVTMWIINLLSITRKMMFYCVLWWKKSSPPNKRWTVIKQNKVSCFSTVQWKKCYLLVTRIMMFYCVLCWKKRFTWLRWTMKIKFKNLFAVSQQ